MSEKKKVTSADENLARRIAIRKAAPWLPTKGEMRTGSLVTVRRVEDTYSGHLVLIMEDEKDGEIFAYHVFSMIEQAALCEMKPVKGSRLTIFNGGKRETNASQRAYTAYEQLKEQYTMLNDKTALDQLKEPERTFYHDNDIFYTDVNEDESTEFSWDG
jgi:hypothetical protein